jgi:uncharacterized protein YjbK
MEVELKLTLDEAGYKKVLAHFKDDIVDELDQWNIFFDTFPENLLRKSGRIARLRSVKSSKGRIKWFICTKAPGTKVDGVWSRPEIETQIDEANAQAILSRPTDFYHLLPPSFQKEFESVEKEKFHVIGDFRNIRRIIPFECLTIEADESTLPNGSVFYELEIEDPDAKAAKVKIESKLVSLGVSFVNSPRGKAGRLMELPEEQRLSRKFGER